MVKNGEFWRLSIVQIARQTLKTHRKYSFFFVILQFSKIRVMQIIAIKWLFSVHHKEGEHFLVLPGRMFGIFSTKTCFSLDKDKNRLPALTNVAMLKTKLLAGIDHVIEDIISEDMQDISLCIFTIPLSAM